MPYIRRGKCVYRKDTGRKVGCSSSVAKAKKYLKKLYAVEEDEETYDVKTFNRLLRVVIKRLND
jgi:hypothetical protein